MHVDCGFACAYCHRNSFALLCILRVWAGPVQVSLSGQVLRRLEDDTVRNRPRPLTGDAWGVAEESGGRPSFFTFIFSNINIYLNIF